MNRFLPPQDRGIILSVFPYDFDFSPSLSLLDMQPALDPRVEPGPAMTKRPKNQVEKKKKKGKKKKARS